MRILLSLYIIFGTFLATGQSSAGALWTSVNVSYEPFKDFRVSLEEGWRIEEYFTDQTYTDLGVRYRPLSFLKVGVLWRNSQRGGFFDTENFDNRFQLDINGDYEYADFELAGRIRFQTKYRDMYTSEDGLLPENYLRYRLMLGYKINKDIAVAFGPEFYNALPFYGGVVYDRYRINSAVEYELNDFLDLELGYIFQKEVKMANPQSVHIVNFSFSFSLTDFLEGSGNDKKDDEIINWYVIP